MPTAMRMNLLDAVNSIGNALKNLANTGPAGKFMQADYPIPEIFSAEAGRPSMTVRFDGIAGDDPDYSEVANSPSDLRFEVRIYHPSYAPAEMGQIDGYVFAQQQVLEGSSEFYSNLKADPTLGNLLLDIGIQGSIAGDLIEPTTGDAYLGHEIILVTSSY